MSYSFSSKDKSPKRLLTLPSGEKKLGRVICPDPWKAGARNTVGESTSRERPVCVCVCVCVCVREREREEALVWRNQCQGSVLTTVFLPLGFRKWREKTEREQGTLFQESQVGMAVSKYVALSTHCLNEQVVSGTCKSGLMIIVEYS